MLINSDANAVSLTRAVLAGSYFSPFRMGARAISAVERRKAHRRFADGASLAVVVGFACVFPFLCPRSHYTYTRALAASSASFFCRPSAAG